MSVVLLQVPESTAEELVAANLAVRSPGTRSGPEVAALIVAAVGVAANVVAIITSVDSLGELVRRLRRSAGRGVPDGSGPEVTIEVTMPDSTKVRIIVRDGSDEAVTTAAKGIAQLVRGGEELPS